MVVGVPEGAVKPKYTAFSRKRKWERDALSGGYDVSDHQQTSRSSPRNAAPTQGRPVRVLPEPVHVLPGPVHVLPEAVHAQPEPSAQVMDEATRNVWGEFKDRRHFVEMHFA